MLWYVRLIKDLNLLVFGNIILLLLVIFLKPTERSNPLSNEDDV